MKRALLILAALLALASNAQAGQFQALYQAILQNDLASVQALTPGGWAINSVDGSTGATPLTWASMKGIRPEIADWLISRGADLEKHDGEGNTPLTTAAFYGNAAVTRLLLRRGADPNAPDEGGRAPIVVAAGHRGNIDVVRALVEAGVDVTGKNGTDAVEMARGCDKHHIHDYLISQGARPSYFRAVERFYDK